MCDSSETLDTAVDKVNGELDGETSVNGDTVKEKPNGDSISVTIEDAVSKKEEDAEKFLAGLAKGFTLTIAYAANVGGVGTSTGTTPNIVMKGFADQYVSQFNTLCYINYSR